MEPPLPCSSAAESTSNWAVFFAAFAAFALFASPVFTRAGRSPAFQRRGQDDVPGVWLGFNVAVVHRQIPRLSQQLVQPDQFKTAVADLVDQGGDGVGGVLAGAGVVGLVAVVQQADVAVAQALGEAVDQPLGGLVGVAVAGAAATPTKPPSG